MSRVCRLRHKFVHRALVLVQFVCVVFCILCHKFAQSKLYLYTAHCAFFFVDMYHTASHVCTSHAWMCICIQRIAHFGLGCVAYCTSLCVACLVFVLSRALGGYSRKVPGGWGPVRARARARVYPCPYLHTASAVAQSLQAPLPPPFRPPLHPYTHTHIRTHARTQPARTHARTHAHKHTHTHTHRTPFSRASATSASGARLCVCVCVRVRVRVRVRVCV